MVYFVYNNSLLCYLLIKPTLFLTIFFIVIVVICLGMEEHMVVLVLQLFSIIILEII